MQTQPGANLFSSLSPQAASQTKGGWASCTTYKCVPKVKVVYKVVRCYDPCYVPYKGSGKAAASSINITNPDIDDGSIVNFTSGSTINLTNPDIDDGSIVNF